MEKYIALLRGINVSGQKLIRMEELVVLMESIDLSRVQSYIQSGNLIFCHRKTSHETLSERISMAIAEKYNFQVPTIVRTANELKAISQNNPFLQNKSLSADRFYVTFLSANPAENCISTLEKSGLTSETYALAGTEIFLHIAEGYGKTKWTNTFFEKKLKVHATTRNLTTIRTLVALSENTDCS